MSRGRSRRPARATAEAAGATSGGKGTTAMTTEQMTFANNGLAAALFGSHHAHLAQIEQGLGVTIHARGNEVAITGDGPSVDRTAAVLAAPAVRRTFVDLVVRRTVRQLGVGGVASTIKSFPIDRRGGVTGAQAAAASRASLVSRPPPGARAVTVRMSRWT